MSKEQLQDFFDNLGGRCITVKENILCSIVQVYNIIDSYKSKSDIGFAFYHKGDTKMAAETGMLYLSWGSYSNDELDILTVANAIIDEGKASGLTIEWEGSTTDRILITDVDVTYFKKQLEESEESE